MAITQSGRAAYTAYRMSSALIHPGLGIGRADIMSDARIGQMADEAAFLVAAYGDALSRSLADDATAIDEDREGDAG